MITINVIEDKICGSYGETPFTVDYSKELYNDMSGLAEASATVNTVEEYNEILEAFAPFCNFSPVLNTLSFKYFCI